jgi:signal transduction histidine kinase
MNNNVQVHEQLMFRHEVLRARLDIRDFFLKNTVREVYENIGQVLSLVRMQLAMLDANKKSVMASIESPGNLVGQSIRDLRVMCKSFYPDADILNDEGFTEALRDTIKILYQYERPEIKVSGIPKEIQPELRLVIFKMIQEILTLIKETEGKFISLIVAYLENEVKIRIIYNGVAIPFDNSTTPRSADLTLEERAQLVEGKLSLTKRKNGLMQIQLLHPLNCIYE